MTKKRTLEIDDDLNFQRKEWFAQRIGITALSIFVVAALLGLTGSGGVLNRGAAGDRNGVYIEYDHIVRRHAPTFMKVHLHSDPPGFIQFWVSAPYLEHIHIKSVTPMPQTETVEESRHVYTIRAGSPDVDVVLEIEHQSWGRLNAEVGIVNGPSARISQMSLF